jgi:hypothetical protein
VLPLLESLGAARHTITEEVRLLVVHQRLADRLGELAQAAVPVLLRAALRSSAAEVAQAQQALPPMVKEHLQEVRCWQG